MLLGAGLRAADGADQKSLSCRGLGQPSRKDLSFQTSQSHAFYEGQWNKFPIPGLSSALWSHPWTQVHQIPPNSPAALFLLPLKTFDVSPTENRTGFVKRIWFNFFLGEKCLFPTDIFFQVNCVLLLHCWRPSLKPDLCAKQGSSFQCSLSILLPHFVPQDCSSVGAFNKLIIPFSPPSSSQTKRIS